MFARTWTHLRPQQSLSTRIFNNIITYWCAARPPIGDSAERCACNICDCSLVTFSYAYGSRLTRHAGRPGDNLPRCRGPEEKRTRIKCRSGMIHTEPTLADRRRTVKKSYAQQKLRRVFALDAIFLSSRTDGLTRPQCTL